MITFNQFLEIEKAPIIDLGGRIAVIDDTQDPPKWKTIAKIFPASRAKAIEVAIKNNLKSFWLIDDTGNKQYINL